MTHVFVSGGSRGIGRAVVEAYLRKGFNVSFIYHSDYDREELISGFGVNKVNVNPIKADVSDPIQVKQAVESSVKVYGDIDILVSVSGISRVGLATDFTFDDYHLVMDTNFGGLFNLCRNVIPMMVHNKTGCIIAVSSMWGQRGASCEALYSASKGAVDSYVKSLAKELGPSGIRVNAVSPGVIDTDMLSCFSEEDKESLKNDTPLMRIGKPEDIANTVLFLSDDAASFITGQIFCVDGGF
ncbi:MAG: SDR family oxidoreductase [Clostridia bacterium]|nr:SDR family oxidoreductase [Clostridia bacterium]